MAVDMFLKVEGADGESQDDAHAGEIDLLAYSFGATNSGTAHLGGGAGAGKVNVKDLSVTKYVDKASPNLLLFCANGKHVPECVLVVRKAGESALEYIKLTMTDCLITSVVTSAAQGQERLTENVGINFAEFSYEYTPQKADGSGDAPVTMGWSIGKNVKK
jgi:type VI secretion system secreted protein Hcp